MNDKRAFLTGSRVYGSPTRESDTDLVIYIEQDELSILVDALDPDDRQGAYPMEHGWVSLTFGDLNLIACWDETAYRAWKEGTYKVLEIKIHKNRNRPVERSRAIRIMNRVRKKLGVKPTAEESDDE